MPLRKDVKSPLEARNDAESAGARHRQADREEAGRQAGRQAAGARPTSTSISIGFEARAVVLPPKAGTYADLQAVKGKLLYRRTPRAGSHDEKSPIVFFDLEEREEKTMLDDADGVRGDLRRQEDAGRAEAASSRSSRSRRSRSFDKPMDLADIEVPVEPRAEWQQIFIDAYRFERDFFYDPGMHGVDWEAMKERYLTLLDDAVTRWDVNWVIGEFLGELNASHTYHGGGDEEHGPERSVGMLGVDWELASGAYRIKHIVRGGPWDAGVRSPLDEPGVNVKEGDYVLAVNGVPLDPQGGSVGQLPGARHRRPWCSRVSATAVDDKTRAR